MEQVQDYLFVCFLFDQQLRRLPFFITDVVQAVAQEAPGAGVARAQLQPMVGKSVLGRASKWTSAVSFLVQVGKRFVSIFHLSEWSLWTSCSKTCGPGSRSRRRDCLDDGGELCAAGAEVQMEACQEEVCAGESHQVNLNGIAATTTNKIIFLLWKHCSLPVDVDRTFEYISYYAQIP